MSILVKATINGTLHRVSDEQLSLTNRWDQLVKRADNVTFSLADIAGGYVKPSYGKIAFSPDLFTGTDWYPPDTIAITIKFTDDTQANAIILFKGNAYRSLVNRKEVVYSLFEDSFSDTISSTTWIDDDLEGVITTYCGSGYLNLTTDFTAGRATSPDVYARIEAGTPIIDMLSDFARATNHLFYIIDGTLYLVDMLLNNGTTITKDYNGGDTTNFFPVRYFESPKYKQFESIGFTKYTVSGSNGFGSIFNSNCANFIEHLYGRIGNNSGDDSLRIVREDIKIPYLSGKYYMMKLKYKRKSGSGNIAAGFQGWADDQTTKVNINGADSYTFPHYINVVDGTSSSWVTKTCYASGWAATGDNTEHPNVASPAVMQTDVAFISPVISANYTSQAGEFNIDFVAIYEVDSGGAIVEELFYQDFKGEFLDQWAPWKSNSGTTNRDIFQSKGESETNIETALTNLKSIMESPRAEISMPLLASNIPDFGQKIEWTDESIGPEGESVSAWIRARKIVFNLSQNKLTVEGEGSIT